MSNYTKGNSFYDSDSFESDTEYTKKGSPRNGLSNRPVASKTEKTFNAYKQSSVASKSRQKNSRKVMQPKRFIGAELEVTAQRILSARKHQIANQNNIIQELHKQMEILKSENKTLKTQTHRQEKALHKIDSKQSDLPRMLDQHHSEITNTKEQLRRTKDTLNNEVKQRKESDNEIVKLRIALTKANQLVSDKNLGERNTLQMQLIETQEKLETSEKTLEATSRHLENVEKSHKREIHNLKKQMRQLENQCNDYEKDLDYLKNTLKEKEKLLEIQNIYCHRIKIPHRLPSTSNDPNPCGVCSGLSNDQMLDKLNFNNINSKETSFNKSAPQPISTDESCNLTYLDPEKIKEDIRKILEEEILSGRIKPVEYQYKNTDGLSNRSQPPERDSPLPESYNTSKVIGSEIFDKDPPTQVQSTLEDSPKPEQNFKRKEILLEKLNAIDRDDSHEEHRENIELKYSFPNDNDFVENDPSQNEIETISTIEVKKPTKSYKFNDTIENLHHGVPVHLNSNDKNSKLRLVDTKKSTITTKYESFDSQISLVLSQKNNSNSDSLRDELLPPLSEADRQTKERELLSELFGQYQSNGSVKNRTTTLPWDSDESNKSKYSNSPPSIRSRSLGKSEEIEEILL